LEALKPVVEEEPEESAMTSMAQDLDSSGYGSEINADEYDSEEDPNAGIAVRGSVSAQKTAMPMKSKG